MGVVQGLAFKNGGGQNQNPLIPNVGYGLDLDKFF